MIILLLFIFIALCTEAFFSGSETAFISVNFLKLVHLIEKKNKYAMLVHSLLKKPDRLLTTTLVGTNLSVVVSSACATAIFSRLNPTYGAILTTLVMTPISFIFCQLLPKTVFRYRANRIVLYVAQPLSISEQIFFPLVGFFTFFANSISKIVNPHGLKRNPFLTKDEIKSLLKDISREGILEAHEREAIDKIFDLTLTKAADVMIPLKKVISVKIPDTIEIIREKCRVNQFTRFPVFEDKKFVGIINIFDIFHAMGEPGAAQEAQGQPAFINWQALIRPILHVDHDEGLDKIFSKMQPNKEVMVAVFQGQEMVGILTMEDLIEHITSKLTSIKKA